MKKFTIIVAGGSGSRMGNSWPKQFLLLAGKPMLMHSIETFFQAGINSEIILVLPQKHISDWEKLCADYHFTIPHRLVAGGETRGHSVKNGLSAINSENGLVAVHDGARPLADKALVNEAFTHAQKSGSAIPCIPVNDSLRQIEGKLSKPIDRTRILSVQTPQCFHLNILREAYARPYFMNFTDDAQLVESIGISVELIEGNRENLKITYPVDLVIAESILNIRMAE